MTENLTRILGLSLHAYHGIESMCTILFMFSCLERINAWNHTLNADALDRPTSFEGIGFLQFHKDALDEFGPQFFKMTHCI